MDGSNKDSLYCVESVKKKLTRYSFHYSKNTHLKTNCEF